MRGGWIEGTNARRTYSIRMYSSISTHDALRTPSNSAVAIFHSLTACPAAGGAALDIGDRSGVSYLRKIFQNFDLPTQLQVNYSA